MENNVSLVQPIVLNAPLKMFVPIVLTDLNFKTLNSMVKKLLSVQKFVAMERDSNSIVMMATSTQATAVMKSVKWRKASLAKGVRLLSQATVYPSLPQDHTLH